MIYMKKTITVYIDATKVDIQVQRKNAARIAKLLNSNVREIIVL